MCVSLPIAERVYIGSFMETGVPLFFFVMTLCRKHVRHRILVGQTNVRKASVFPVTQHAVRQTHPLESFPSAVVAIITPPELHFG